MEQELQRLDGAIAAGPTPELYMQRGRLLWRLQRHAAAMADYERATALAGPDSPAAAALAMAREVMDFYNKDLYNP
ncbi:MAG: tetratricopeptide repeat protein [Muribaculaceae bacterium]|nr:tetratricopeptide repeat protein [Muribaculaceae bacterium]